MYNNISAEKCFSNSNDSNKSSCDYTKKIKQKTIYNNIVKQVQSQTNFIKSNGVNYNQNFGLHNNCLAFAKSYDLLLDVTKGKYYSQPTVDHAWVSNESWSAGLYSVNYSANGVNAVVDTSYNAGNANKDIFPMTQPAELADISWNGLYPGVRIDPSYNIFYNECENQNYWRDKLVDMSYNNTNYYKQNKQKSEQLYGMAYPANVSFNCRVIDISTIAVNPSGDGLNWFIVENKIIQKFEILNIEQGISLTLNNGIRLTVLGTLNNNGTINTKPINIPGISSIIDNTGKIINTGIINCKSIINNKIGGEIYNTGIIYNINSAAGNINNTGLITNIGSIYNMNGNIFNNAGGEIINNEGGQINNEGQIFNNANGKFTNNAGGEIINNEGGQIYNVSNTFNNSGIIYNNTIGQIDNTGTITNIGDINNNIGSIFTNQSLGRIDNDGGTITNTGTFDNNIVTAIIYNYASGTINNSGTFIPGGNLNNADGTLTCGTGTLSGGLVPTGNLCPPP